MTYLIAASDVQSLAPFGDVLTRSDFERGAGELNRCEVGEVDRTAVDTEVLASSSDPQPQQTYHAEGDRYHIHAVQLLRLGEIECGQGKFLSRESALSFEFDSSQSLFEQLTKAQQTNSSSFNTNVQSYSQGTSPVIRANPRERRDHQDC